MKRTKHLACEDYTPVSDAYADYQAEHIGEYYGDLQLQELERRVSLYHLGYEDA